MRFQILSWDSSEDEDRYIVHMYGRTKDGKSVCLDVEYEPYFYLEESNELNANLLELKEKWRVSRYTRVKREKFYGFHNYKQYSFYKLYFKTKREWYSAQYKCKALLEGEANKRHKVWTMYESNLDPMLKFIHEKDIKTSGWVEVDKFKSKKVGYKVDYHLEATKDNVSSLDIDDIAPFVIASFDIECYSDTGEFPNPEKECPVIQIATKFQRCGETEAYRTHLVTLKSCDVIDGVELDSYENEKDVIERWIEVLNEEKVDCLLGYNIWGFDMWYLWTRAIQVDAEFDLTKSTDECSYKVSHFSSSAYGDNDYKMVKTPGIFQLDLLVQVKRDHKLSKYSLNAVSEHFLNEYKVDLSPKEMFKKFEMGSADRKIIGVYCVQDVNLPLRLINKLGTFTNLIEMAKVTWVPVSYLIERGQGIKVFSQLCYTCKFEKMVIETFTKNRVSSDDTAYVGATVLTAKTGAYINQPITGLDFASLYPTIMRAHNLCPSTLAIRPDMQYVDNVNYTEIDGYRFVQDRQGVIPKMLEELAKSRKKAKKDMANATDPFMKSVYNGKQLAFKVSMNSIYGGVGSPTFNVPCKPVASCTTSKGREMIEQTKNLVEEWYPGSDVVYGDSVSGDTPLLLKYGNINKIKRIDELEGEWKNYQSDKIYFEPKEPIYVWNDTGFTEIKKVIKHKTKKRMYRILTHEGIVDVTEDHSLVRSDKEIIKPNELTLSTELLHYNIEEFGTENQISLEEAKVMGFFMGDGSCGRYETKWGIKYTWGLNHQNLEYLKEMQENAPFETSILNTMKSSHVYKLVATGDVKRVTERYRIMFYNMSKEKVVPFEILNSTKEIQKAFWDGYYMADGSKCDNTIRCDAKGKQGVFGLYIIAKRLGYSVSINSREDKLNVFRLNMTKSYQRKETNKIKKIIDLGMVDDYVYDLETENHHFHVGPGSLIVHNTDSVMVHFPTDSVEESFKLGEEAAERISATFPKPIELEFEKVYSPYLLFSKKRYAGLMYTNPEKPDYIDAKGIQLVRRDNCPIVRKILKELLDIIMYENDVEKAKMKAIEYVMKLDQNKIEIDDLVVSKSLKRISYEYDSKGNFKRTKHDYKNPQPHVTVAEKLEKREKGSGPKSGERVPYVFVEVEDKKALQYEKAEDPDYVKQNNIPIDVEYYKTHALLSPIESLMELFYDNVKGEIFDYIEKIKQVDLFDL